ncbi:hypothetical protein M3_0202 [Lysinibacillus phage vB_LfM_LysYB1]|nr:hypothetical protein M3_0202 [Lysinibacillus phage vB_LfM_LysYB1]WAB25286.1 hypothetical protein M5_0108 [Lysinibacillus phage vB_LfM_LysYB2]
MENNGQVQVLEERVEQLSKTVDKLETTTERLSETVSNLSQQSIETKVYVSQIFQMLEDIKSQLKSLGDKSDKNTDQDSNRWIDFFKQISFLAIGALVTYLMTKG